MNRYIKTLLHYKPVYKNIGVFAPIASGKNNAPQENEHNLSYKTDRNRNIITKLFNEYLEQQSRNNDIFFKSVFYDLIDTDMNTKIKYYSPDQIHLGVQAQSILFKCFEENNVFKTPLHPN